MSSCKIDHSLEDVKNKLRDQAPFMDQSLVDRCNQFLSTSISQTELNELFHLLKKFDLASEEEKDHRIEKMKKLFN